MPKLFARQTALSNVGGRIDYISNPKRQENLLAVHDGADDAYWHQLARECKLASKHIDPKQDKKSVQGRELMFQLSNSLLQRLSPEEIAGTIAKRFEEKFNRPCVVAIHFNKGEKSLHAHVIYSERELLPEPNEKIAPRALFFDEHGKRQYKKAAVLDEDGKLRPGCKIVQKGEVYEKRYFGPVDPQFSSKAWLKKAKSEWILPLRNGELRGDVEIREFDRARGEIPQQYIGNNIYRGAPDVAAKIEAYNQDVKQYNQLVEDGTIPQETARLIQEQESHVKKGKGFALRRIIKRAIEMLNAGKNRIPVPEPEQEPERKPSLFEKILGAEKRRGIPSTSERSNQEPER